MPKGTFFGGTRDVEMVFTTNGERSIDLVVPKGTVVKSGGLTVEVRDLPQRSINRLGLVRNCPLSDFHALEEALEHAERRTESVLRGWGVPGGDMESENFAVIPVDPAEMLTATPSRYRTEYDAVIIPNGESDLKLEALIHSGVPVITMNPAVAQTLGLGEDVSLHAGITLLRIADTLNYITEGVGRESLQVAEGGEYVVVDALTPGRNSVTIADTGTASQCVVVLSLERKYCYFGVLEATDLISGKVFPTFLRAVEWCGVGGTGADVRLSVGGSSLELGGKRSLRIKNIAQLLEEARQSSKGERVPLRISASSPCRVYLRDLDMDLAYVAILNHFSGEKEVIMEFDSLTWAETKIILPRDAFVRYATMRVESHLLNERVANRWTDTSGEYGMLLTPVQEGAERIRPRTALLMKRASFMLAKVQDETELEVSLVEGGDAHPSREVLVSETLEAGAIPVGYSWVDIEMECALDPKKTYWFRLRPLRGEVRWRCTPHAQGSLMYTRDGGRRWNQHMMEALHKVVVEAPEVTMPMMALESVRIWSGKRNIEQVDDFSTYLNDYLLKAPRSSREVEIPLRMFTEVMGSARLFDLVVEYETSEEVESEAAEIRSIVELIESLRVRVDELARRLGPKAEELRIVGPENE